MDVEYIEISRIKPAPYNPRVINESQLGNLRCSIAKNGLIIPVIVNKDNMIIVAGHQRTKAAIACGIKYVPVLFVRNVSRDDEIKFNQLHNGTESVASGNVDTMSLPEGFQCVDGKKNPNPKKSCALCERDLQTIAKVWQRIVMRITKWKNYIWRKLYNGSTTPQLTCESI